MSASPLSAQLPRPGDMIAGKYLLDRLLGQGGMGAVFAAKHVKLSKAVAIKIMLADASNPEAAQRFINEGRAAANIQNEHVVRVDDVDEEMGYAYMVLELLEGEDLAQVLERELTHRLAPHVAVNYVLQALKGVMQAHAIGIVHRDLKPSNLFLAKRKDGTVVVKVLDFGISKAQGSSALAASPSALTSTKAMLGSPLYMSPEQLRSSKSVDQRADIWAMGIILYELITGSLPFMGDNLGELFAAILETDPPPLRLRADVPNGLEEIVLRCLQRKPEHRFQHVGELVHALTPFAVPLPGMGLSGINHQAPFSSMGTGALSAGAVTPNYSGPQLPVGGAATGSGPRMIAPGTAPLGAVTPPGAMMQTGGGWQSTGSGTNVLAVPKSKMPLFAALGIVALFALGVGLGGILFWSSKRPKVDVTTNASSTPPPSASGPAIASVVPTPPDPPPVTSTPAAPATSMAAVDATPPPTKPTTTTFKHTPTPPTTTTPKQPEPTPTLTQAATKPKPPPPTPTATSSGTNLVNTR